MAGAGWRDFVPGEVLTAANVQDYLQDQAVMTFASAAARTSALASPTEGMVSYLKDTNIVQMYTGSSWVTVADDNGLPIANGGTGATTAAAAQDALGVGLAHVIPSTVAQAGGSASANAQGLVTFTTVTSLSLNGVFTSAYRNYRIVFQASSSAGNPLLYGRFRDGGVDNTASVQSYVRIGSYVNSVGNGGVGINSAWNDNKAYYAYLDTNNTIVTIDVASPELAAVTVSTAVFSASTSTALSVGTNYNMHNATTQFSAITFYPASGNITGTVQVFGYNI